MSLWQQHSHRRVAINSNPSSSPGRSSSVQISQHYSPAMTDMFSGLHVGQQFASLEDFKKIVRGISVRQHWELRVARSNKKSVVIGCRSSPNCYFRVVCRANKNETYITSLQDSHSCRRNEDDASVPTPARSEASHVRFLLTEIPKLFDMRNKIKGQEVVDAVKRYHGYDISMRQAQRALRKLQPRPRANKTAPPEGAASEQQTAQLPRLNESQGDGGSGYSSPYESRWIHDNLRQVIETANGTSNDGRNNSVALVESRPQPGRPPGQVYNPQIQQSQAQQPQEQPHHTHPPEAPTTQAHLPQARPHVHPHTTIDRNLPPLNASHPSFARSTGNQPPAPQCALPGFPSQPPLMGNPAASHLILTNFKIEFTCTTCGALNQSLFPNQGNVTGGRYLLPHHRMPNQRPDSVAGNAGSSSTQNGTTINNNTTTTNNDDSGGDDLRERATTSNSNGTRSPLTPGGSDSMTANS